MPSFGDEAAESEVESLTHQRHLPRYWCGLLACLVTLRGLTATPQRCLRHVVPLSNRAAPRGF